MSVTVNLPADASGWTPYMREELRARWREFAACTEPSVNLEDFFPVNIAADRIDRERATRRARFVCAPCPVKRTCLAHGLGLNAEGIWAATTAAQRRPFVRAIRKKMMTYDDAVTALVAIGKTSATTGSYGPANPEEWVDVA